MAKKLEAGTISGNGFIAAILESEYVHSFLRFVVLSHYLFRRAFF